MKKLLTIAICGIGLFLVAGVASASTADTLQPASGPTYDGLTVDGTAIFDSIKVGKQGVGGVTFFNGTIINITTDDDGNDNPVTFGDNVRIDGRIWRGEEAGSGDDMPVIVNDDLEVDGTLTADAVYASNIFQAPWLSSQPTDGCSTSSDLGKYAFYDSAGDTGVSVCGKSSGVVQWVHNP